MAPARRGGAAPRPAASLLVGHRALKGHALVPVRKHSRLASGQAALPPKPEIIFAQALNGLNAYGTLRLNLALRDADRSFAVNVEEDIVVGNDLLNDLRQFLDVVLVDDCMHTVAEGLHGIQGLEGIAKKENGRVPPLIHRHYLKVLQGEVFFGNTCVKQLLQKNDLILDAGKASDEVTMIEGGMDFVSEPQQGGPGGFDKL